MTYLAQRILQQPILRSQLFRLASIALLLIALQSICPQNSLAQTNTFPSTGNVGIGTSSPAELLHLNAPGFSVAQIQFQAGDKAGYFGAWAGGGFFITSNRSIRTGGMFNPANGGAQITLGSGYEDGNILFHTVSSSGTVSELTRINKNGFVGIGQTNPQFTLEWAVT